MGQKVRQPAAATVLALGGIPIKSSPITAALAAMALACGVLVLAALAAEADIRWINVSIGAACVLAFLAAVSKALEVVGYLLNTHSQDMRQQVLNLNWLVTSQAGGRERARIDAARMYGADGPTDSGPFKIVNGAG